MKDQNEDGHRIVRWDSTIAPFDVFMQDPCPFGLPETMTVAHEEKGACKLPA